MHLRRARRQRAFAALQHLGPYSQHRDRRNNPRAPNRAYPSLALLDRGASSGDVRKMEQGAVPAGEARNLALGRLRGPARPALRPVCEELAGLGLGASSRPRKRGPGTGPRPLRWRSGEAAVERREARLLDRKRRRHASQACRAASPAAHGASHAPAFLGAPLPSHLGAKKKAKLGRVTRREKGDGCLKFGSGCLGNMRHVGGATLSPCGRGWRAKRAG
jgi:hypothetical protein